ncbi:DNA topology modulation protein FlaR [Candidatus Woesearchaeota archaeon]|nr:DNA topology modulation protein FlaR [Candidatus Woesearchaeota archaeon]
MKIRIIGGLGSGKSYLAKKLSKKFNMPFLPLDDIVWAFDPGDFMEKNPLKERDALLQKTLNKKHWIIEGVYAEPWTKPTITQADYFIYLDVPKMKRHYRAIRRFILGKLSLTHCYERNWKEMKIIFGLDKGWDPGIRKVAKNAMRFSSADEAYEYIVQQEP